MHFWRSALLRVFGAKIGRGVHVYPNVRIWAPWNLEIADGAGVGDGAILYSQGPIRLGKWCVISQGAHLCTGTHDFNALGFPLIVKPITVGDSCWVAAEAFVHPGVTLGEGTVVGARSVVTKDLPAWTICSGFPAEVLKPRKRLARNDDVAPEN